MTELLCLTVAAFVAVYLFVALLFDSLLLALLGPLFFEVINL